MSILTVDDEPSIGSAITRLLSPLGHQVVAVQSAEAALTELRRTHYDVVLTDLDMGNGLDGWELAEQIQQRWPATRVVLVTGWGAGIDAATAYSRGVHALVGKPFRRTDLESVLTLPGADPPPMD